jgi:hypothetical protein
MSKLTLIDTNSYLANPKLRQKMIRKKSKDIGLAFGELSTNAVTQTYHRIKQRILLDKQLKINI